MTRTRHPWGAVLWRHRIRGRLGHMAAVLVLVAAASAGCSFDPSDHALPGTGIDGPTYRLDVEFESLLSLPAGAEVRSNGVEVGSLTAIDLRGDSAIAEIEVSRSVRLPVGTRAELRQTTVLGDIYLALLPPRSSEAGFLADGSTIPLRDTDSGAQIEEMLAQMAAFVNGGSITRMQEAIEELNRALPSEPAEVTDLAEVARENIGGARERMTDLDRLVRTTGDLSARLHQMRDEVAFIFSETARRRLDRVPYFMTSVLNLTIDVNTLTTGLDWLIPRLPHINVALARSATILREPSPHATQVYGNAGRMRDLISTKVLPFVVDPAVDIRRLSLGKGQPDATRDALVVMRMIGALR